MAADRLSSLPDDLLRRVLRLAPAREGAATAVLSRRWRAIWRTSGAVNLVATGLENPEGFFRAAEAALAAAQAHGDSRVTKLTFHVKAAHGSELYWFLNHRRGERSHHPRPKHNMVDDVLSNPAARRVEELRVLVEVADWPLVRKGPLVGGRIYSLSFGALPSGTLRLLHVVNCRDLGRAPPPGVVFRRLEAVQLEGCTAPLVDLQGVIDGAPQLATLHLEYCSLQGGETRWHGLHCPSITSLALLNCCWPRGKEEEANLELHAPLLQYFRYEGQVGDARPVSLKKSSAVTNLIRVDLRFGGYIHGGNETRELFWQLVRNFSLTRVLKVKLEFGMEHMAIVDKNDRDEILGTDLLSNLECLELEGRYDPASKSDAMAIENFLHCCPVVRDLRLKVTKKASDLITIASPLQQHQFDLDKSIDHFRRRRRSVIPLGGEDEDLEVPDIPCLSEHSFDCLQSYLRRVSLQFWMEDHNCLGIQLAKFFAANAMVLEEMHIADGNHKMCEHINRRIERWAASSSKRRNSPTSFIVLPGEM